MRATSKKTIVFVISFFTILIISPSVVWAQFPPVEPLDYGDIIEEYGDGFEFGHIEWAPLPSIQHRMGPSEWSWFDVCENTLNGKAYRFNDPNVMKGFTGNWMAEFGCNVDRLVVPGGQSLWIDNGQLIVTAGIKNHQESWNYGFIYIGASSGAFNHGVLTFQCTPGYPCRDEANFHNNGFIGVAKGILNTPGLGLSEKTNLIISSIPIFGGFSSVSVNQIAAEMAYDRYTGFINRGDIIISPYTTWYNQGYFENKGTGKIIVRGQLVHGSSAIHSGDNPSFVNDGEILVETYGSISNLDYFENNGDLTIKGTFLNQDDNYGPIPEGDWRNSWDPIKNIDGDGLKNSGKITISGVDGKLINFPPRSPASDGKVLGGAFTNMFLELATFGMQVKSISNPGTLAKMDIKGASWGEGIAVSSFILNQILSSVETPVPMEALYKDLKGYGLDYGFFEFCDERQKEVGWSYIKNSGTIIVEKDSSILNFCYGLFENSGKIDNKGNFVNIGHMKILGGSFENNGTFENVGPNEAKYLDEHMGELIILTKFNNYDEFNNQPHATVQVGISGDTGEYYNHDGAKTTNSNQFTVNKSSKLINGCEGTFTNAHYYDVIGENQVRNLNLGILDDGIITGYTKVPKDLETRTNNSYSYAKVGCVVKYTVRDAGAVNVMYGGVSGLQPNEAQAWGQNDFRYGTPEKYDEFGYALSSGDFDGDGYDDLAIGVRGESIGPLTGAGAAHVIYGDDKVPDRSDGGLETTGEQFWVQGEDGLEGRSEKMDLFGHSLAVGDFDNDGYDDLAIGVPKEDVGSIEDAGAVNIIYGDEEDGLFSKKDQLWHQDTGGVSGTAEGSDMFGFALSAGDFNGDGATDLAIGAPGEAVGPLAFAGAVTVLYSSDSKLRSDDNDLWHQDKSRINGVAETGDRFGAALASGDFDGDGYDDLAIGVPGEAIGSKKSAGAVNVIYGRSSGLKASGDQVWHQDTSGIRGAAEKYDRFGFALAVGDFDGDGYDDLAIGAPGEAIGSKNSAGAVNVLYGRSSGLDNGGDEIWYQDVKGLKGDSEADDLFGYSLAAGDFDNDGYDDLAIGVPGEDWGYKDSGLIQILYGESSGLSTSGDELWAQNNEEIPGRPEAGDRFGSSLAVGDFNADGYDDLAIGVPHEDTEVSQILDTDIQTEYNLGSPTADGFFQQSVGPGLLDPIEMETISESDVAPSPRHQIESGVFADEVKCKQDRVLVLNNFDSRPACVTESGAEMLESLGWGTRT